MNKAAIMTAAGFGFFLRGFAKHFVFFSALGVLIFLSCAAPASSLAATDAFQAGATFRDCPHCPEMVVVPAGNFLMGTSKADMERDMSEIPRGERTSPIPFLIKGPADYMAQEMPQHPVHIAHPFALGKYPVTVGEFATFVRETGYTTSVDCIISTGRGDLRLRGTWQRPGFPQTDRDPVVCINAHDAAAYIAWLNTKVKSPASTATPPPYHLPSEAEWEYAARAGTQTAYWWGNSIGSGNTVCNACGSRWDNKRPAPVGSFPPNQFGLYDMLGNAWEITADCWNENYSNAPSDGDAWKAENCEKRVKRGGSWDAEPWALRAATRAYLPLNIAGNNLGFRVAQYLK